MFLASTRPGSRHQDPQWQAAGKQPPASCPPAAASDDVSDDEEPVSGSTVSPFRTLVRRGGLIFAAALPLAALVGVAVDGGSGAAAGAIGMAVPAFFFGVTVVVASVSETRPPHSGAGLLLVSWLVKLVVLLAALGGLRTVDFYNKGVFLGAFAVGVILWLAAEMVVVGRAKVPYVVPQVTPPEAGQGAPPVSTTGRS
jgi:hypothetical protein